MNPIRESCIHLFKNIFMGYYVHKLLGFIMSRQNIFFQLNGDLYWSGVLLQNIYIFLNQKY